MVTNVRFVTVPECETGEIRPVGGVTNSTGRLEVCGNGMWGKVCNYFQFWGPDDARVCVDNWGFQMPVRCLLEWLQKMHFCRCVHCRRGRYIRSK